MFYKPGMKRNEGKKSLIDEDVAFYAYGIREIKENENNPEIYDLYFGSQGKLPYHFHKDKLPQLVEALMPDFDGVLGVREGLETYKNKLLDYVNYLLSGRTVVMVTDFANYLDYFNGGQCGVIGVTSIDINGRYKAKILDEIFKDKVTYEELYPKKDANNENLENEIKDENNEDIEDTDEEERE